MTTPAKPTTRRRPKLKVFGGGPRRGRFFTATFNVPSQTIVPKDGPVRLLVQLYTFAEYDSLPAHEKTENRSFIPGFGWALGNLYFAEHDDFTSADEAHSDAYAEWYALQDVWE